MVTEPNDAEEKEKKDTDAANAEIFDEEEKLKVVGQGIHEDKSTEAVKGK